MIVKLFGGAQVLTCNEKDKAIKTIGEQNVIQAKKILKELGIAITSADIGGTRGRKLFFSIMTGEIYLRKLRPNKDICFLRILE